MTDAIVSIQGFVISQILLTLTQRPSTAAKLSDLCQVTCCLALVNGTGSPLCP
jgi:hypothetical protein